MSKFQSTLGMYEMEVAAEVIMNKIEKNGSMATFTYLDFYNLHEGKNEDQDDRWQMIGFCELLHRGWLDRAMYNGQYTASKQLLERLVKNSQDIPKYIPTEPKDEFEIQMRKFQSDYKGAS